MSSSRRPGKIGGLRVRFDKNKAALRFVITLHNAEGEVVETIPKQLMGSTNATGMRSPRISLTSKHIPDCIKKTRASGYKLFERALFAYDGPSDDAEQLTVKEVAGTNYGDYYNSSGEVVDASEVVWHFEYKGNEVEIAALKLIRVELLEDEDVAVEGGMEGQ